MKQLIPFDTTKGGNVPLYCLRNVRLGYGIAGKYSNAITAWNNTEQHKDRNFPALDIPVYFSWKIDGHIGVRLKDGRFWTDGKIYPSLEAYEKNSSPIYLGWGESVNDVKVITGEEVMTEDGVRFGILAVTGGKPMKNYETEVKYWIGRDSTEFSRYLYGMSNYYMVKAYNDIDKLNKQLAECKDGDFVETKVYIKRS